MLPISLLFSVQVYGQRNIIPLPSLYVAGGRGMYRDYINLLRDQVSGSREVTSEEPQLQMYLIYMM